MWHIQAYSVINQAYSETCVILACSKPWYIQNKRHIENYAIFRTVANSEPEAFSEHLPKIQGGAFCKNS